MSLDSKSKSMARTFRNLRVIGIKPGGLLSGLGDTNAIFLDPLTMRRPVSLTQDLPSAAKRPDAQTHLRNKEHWLRMVPSFATAHTFCASRDTRVSYGCCLLIQGYFCAV